MGIMKILGSTHGLARRLGRQTLVRLYRSLFASHGKRFQFDPHGHYTFDRIHVGNDVELGERAFLAAANSRIYIGDKVTFGPDVVVTAGNCHVPMVARFMRDTRGIAAANDRDVVIEDDVFVGARAILPPGVVVGRGAIIGAGAIATKSVPPHAVVGGAPARIIKFCWDFETILLHEEVLYPLADRLSRETLEAIQNQSEDSCGVRILRVAA
jgi:acetyltransferase-like isoleucine patch superfamily enzyme